MSFDLQVSFDGQARCRTTKGVDVQKCQGVISFDLDVFILYHRKTLRPSGFPGLKIIEFD